MTDMVPELNNRITTSFRTRMSRDPRVRQITRKMAAGNATLVDAQAYSERVGVNISESLKEHLTESTLPNGQLYYNIADRTVRPMLETGYELVNENAAEIQKAIDAGNGIGLNPAKAEFPKKRTKGLIDMMTAEDIDLEEALKWIDEPVVNNTMSYFDDFVSKNVEVSSRAGLTATIKRTASWRPCGWCADLAGSYIYGEHPDDIFRRHENCRCVVIYSKEKGKYQDVHSKKVYNKERDARIARINENEGQRRIREQNRAEMLGRIRRGEYSLKLSEQKYFEHVQGTPQYENTAKTRGVEPSRLTVSYEQAQTLIELYAGTGAPFVSKGIVRNKEYITANYYVGEFKIDGKWVKTRRFILYYGENSTHIVPARPDYKGRYYG